MSPRNRKRRCRNTVTGVKKIRPCTFSGTKTPHEEAFAAKPILLPTVLPMRIAVLSDSHDHIPNLHRAVRLANREGAEILIHCGDLISPFMLPYLGAFGGQVHLIYGNNAGDQHLISSRCAMNPGKIRHHGFHGAIVAGSIRIAFNHYPELARELAVSGAYDLVCYGHDHLFHVERRGTCLLLNPGDLLGKEANPAFALLDTDDFSVRRIEAGARLLFDD